MKHFVTFRAVLHKNDGRGVGPDNFKTEVSPSFMTPEGADEWLTDNMRVGVDGGHVEERVPEFGWCVYTGEFEECLA